jgi:hypothetical protein
MKIKLERKLFSCPDRLNCLVCRQPFQSGKLRNLLWSDRTSEHRQLLLGDLCPTCVTQGEAPIQKSLRMEANRSLKPTPERGVPTVLGSAIASHRQALELLLIADEAVQFPSRGERWLKHLELFVQESQELEAARFDLGSRGERSRLERLLREKQ